MGRIFFFNWLLYCYTCIECQGKKIAKPVIESSNHLKLKVRKKELRYLLKNQLRLFFAWIWHLSGMNVSLLPTFSLMQIYYISPIEMALSRDFPTFSVEKLLNR